MQILHENQRTLKHVEGFESSPPQDDIMNHIVVSKNNIQLTKHRNPSPISKNIRVVVQQNKAINVTQHVQQNIQKQAVKTPTVIITPSVKPPSRQVSTKQSVPKIQKHQNLVVNKVIKKKNGARLQYVSHDISEDSKNKIRKLYDIGRGRILVIIANGPSINQVDIGKLRGLPRIDTMSINKPDPRIWPTTYWAFCDPSQYNAHVDLWNDYTGTIINSTGVSQQKENSLQIRNIGGPGFSRDIVKGFHIGRSTTYANMQTALWMGYDKIYIFGVDMCEVDGMLHFYGVNPAVAPDMRKSRFQKESEFYAQAAEWLEDEARSKFVFCSSYNPWGFVDKYCKLDHKIAIDHIINNHCK